MTVLAISGYMPWLPLTPAPLSRSELRKPVAAPVVALAPRVVRPRGASREDRSAYDRQLRQRRLAAGLCGHCGSRPRHEGRVKCAECTSDQASVSAKRYAACAELSAILARVGIDAKAYRINQQMSVADQGAAHQWARTRLAAEEAGSGTLAPVPLWLDMWIAIYVTPT